jgi:HPt (histidine-containing phosphotransfer) domain-containing protein
MSSEDKSVFVLDFEQLSLLLKIPKEAYIRILGKAVAQTQEDIHQLEAALPVGDFEKIQAIAHRLKGDYDNMRIPALSLIARQMNELAKTTRDKSAINDLLTKFKDLFLKLQKSLEGAH